MDSNKIGFVCFAVFALLCIACGGEEGVKSDFSIHSSLGEIKVRLYEDTKGHKERLLLAISENYYEKADVSFMQQDSLIQIISARNKEMESKALFHLDEAIQAHYIHKKGAVVIHRHENYTSHPDLESSLYQFSIITGGYCDNRLLDSAEWFVNERMFDIWLARQIADSPNGEFQKISKTLMRRDSLGKLVVDPSKLHLLEEYRASMRKQWESKNLMFTYSPEARATYLEVGGQPLMDGQYTIVGEVVEGMGVLDAMNACQVDDDGVPFRWLDISLE